MKIIRIISRVLLWILIGILGLLIVVLLSIQTPFVKRQIVNIAEKQINPILNAELEIGRLKGNYFTNLALENILLLSEQRDTIAFLPEISLNYKLWPLLKNEILVKNIRIEKPFVHLEQLPDSSWNLAHLVKPSQDENPDTSSSGFNMKITLGQFALNSGRVEVDAMGEIIPKRIDQLNIQLSGDYSSSEQNVVLSDFNFMTVEPDLILHNLSLTLNADQKQINLKDLLLQTHENRLVIAGVYHFSGDEASQLSLQTTPLKLDEFKAFLPDSLNFGAEPTIDLQAKLKKEILNLDLKLKDREQGIDLQLLSVHLIESLTDTSIKNVQYDLTLNLEQMDMRYWLDDPGMNYLVDGRLVAKGEGIDPQTMQSKINGNFGNMMISGNAVDKLDLVVDYQNGDVWANIEGITPFGQIRIKPEVKDLLGARPAYTADVKVDEFNLAGLTGDPQTQTDLNLQLGLKGSGFDVNSLTADAELNISPSVLMGLHIDTLTSVIEFANQNLVINSLLLRTIATQAEISGNYDLKGNSDIVLNLQVDSINEFRNFADVGDLKTSAKIDAHLYGKVDDLKADVFLNIAKTKYADYQFDSLGLSANASLKQKNINADAHLKAYGVNAMDMRLNTLGVDVKTDTETFDIALKADGEELKTRFNALLKLGDAIQLALSDFWLDYKTYEWKQSEEQAQIKISDSVYEIDNLYISSGDDAQKQFIYANGIINRSGNQDFMLQISGLDIPEVLNVTGLDIPVQGTFNLNTHIQGPAYSPLLEGKLCLEYPGYNGYILKTFTSDMAFKNGILDLNLDVVPQDSGVLAVNAKLPFVARLDQMSFDLPTKESVSVLLRIDSLPLSIARLVMPMDETQGIIKSEVNVSGSLDQPIIEGFVNLSDGSIRIDQYGVNYNDMQVDVDFYNKRIKIDTFWLQSRKGSMKIDGEMDFKSDFYQADLSASSLHIGFDRFYPFNHKHYSAEISGDVYLSADSDSTRLSGDLTIPEAQVYLPAVLAMMGRPSVPELDKPLLLEALERDSLPADSLVFAFHQDSIATKQSFAFLNNIQGKLRVKIPRNTWIKNDDMRIELSGDVELIKHQEFFEIFGNVDVVRGQYDLLGKVFIVQTGSIIFQGGKKINPRLDVTALYKFRDSERKLRELQLSVTGEMLSPVIAFSLDGEALSEGDALSYILFGERIDDLGAGQSGSDVNVADMAGSLAASMISSKLTQLLGNRLNVDYIEFKSSGSFDNASLVVGKYITNDLFVSYEQHIGQVKDDDVATYEMRMEYEIFKFLFLQLTSSSLSNGFDFIFKFDSK